MSDYTPSMEQLRDVYCSDHNYGGYAAEFDRAIAAHDAELREQIAWELDGARFLGVVPKPQNDSQASHVARTAPQSSNTGTWASGGPVGPQNGAIANEKDEKMVEYKLPDEPDGPLWDKAGSKWVRVKENMWYGGIQDMYRVWGDVVHYAGPLTTTPPTPPIKEGDTGLTAEQVWNLPKGSVIWPERAENPEPWMRFSNMWESFTDVSYGAGDLQCLCGDSFRVLILGGGE